MLSDGKPACIRNGHAAFIKCGFEGRYFVCCSSLTTSEVATPVDLPFEESESMHPNLEAHASLWTDKIELPIFSQLHANRQVDVCVIGAGIAGLSLLISYRKKVLCYW